MDRRALLQNVGLVGITASLTYWAGRRTPFTGRNYVQIGTSITSEGKTPAVVGDRLGVPSINAGFPGTLAGADNKSNLGPMSLYSLADAVASQSWDKQITYCTVDPRYRAPLARLMAADFGNGAYVGLEYGTNEYHYDIKIGEDADQSQDSLKGALNHSIQRLLTVFPDLRLFLITPSWMLTHDDRDSDQYPNSIGLFLRDYVEAMLKVAQLNHIPCLDMWRNLGVNRTNFKTFTADGTHPNEVGAKRRGAAIASFIGSVF
jgi:hypothetical protein